MQRLNLFKLVFVLQLLWLTLGCCLEHKVLPDCASVKQGQRSGVFAINPNDGEPAFDVYCHIEEEDKLTVIQRRMDGHLDFYRNYVDYANGFGNVEGDHWLGLEKIHQITKGDDYSLMIQLEAHNGTKAHARYRVFKVGSAKEGYALTIGEHVGSAGNSLSITDPVKFSTFDKDQDLWEYGSCAELYHGAWWYTWCMDSNLNGKYFDTAEDTVKSMHWWHLFGDRQALKTSRMFVYKRPAQIQHSE